VHLLAALVLATIASVAGADVSTTGSLFGMPIQYPDFPARHRNYGLVSEGPFTKFLGPGRYEVQFSTFHAVPHAIAYIGLNTLDEELDYPRYRDVFRDQGSTSPTTSHRLELDFRKLLNLIPNTEYEPRITYRVELFPPHVRSSRFFEGSFYFNPQTLGDTVNIAAGPFVAHVTTNSATIVWETDRETTGGVILDSRTVAAESQTTRHVALLRGLSPGQTYEYRVAAGDTLVRPYSFRTQTDGDFTFAAMIDSREGFGGGEINLYAVEARALNALMSLAYYARCEFVLFVGDLTGGYLTDTEDYYRMLNAFRRLIAPVWARIPVYTSMGNHEAHVLSFDDGSQHGVRLDKPGNLSAEAIFADVFYNPEDGPSDEGPQTPTYKENVYTLDHANCRIVVLNNNYWWSSAPQQYGGNLEGYILPRQMQWFRAQMAAADADPHIKHVFVAAHEPPFPNGGHTVDAMWYAGGDTNRDRRVDHTDIAIIENRNEMWEIVAGSPKVVAFITGDEHAYSRLLVTPETDVGHKRKTDGTEATFAHTIWQITSGGAGAPWYDKELHLPWSPWLKAHSTQPHCALFKVSGDNVELEVHSQTGQIIDQLMLRRDGKNLEK
jgi:hypothetical protein